MKNTEALPLIRFVYLFPIIAFSYCSTVIVKISDDIVDDMKWCGNNKSHGATVAPPPRELTRAIQLLSHDNQVYIKLY